MHLLFLDESGTHRGSPVLIVAGLSLHESHLAEVSHNLDQVVSSALASLPVDPADYELHAAEIKSPPRAEKRPGKRKRKASIWLPIPYKTRMAVLNDAYEVLRAIRCTDHTCGLFACVMDSKFHPTDSEHDRERMAYENVLAKFDDSLKRDPEESLGLVIHDQRIAAEKDIRAWTAEWQESEGRLGRQIERVTLAPFFADSRGSRLLQAADLVSWALNRYYGQNDETRMKDLWDQFDTHEGHMHGAIHLTPGFAKGRCICPPCTNRSPDTWTGRESNS